MRSHPIRQARPFTIAALCFAIASPTAADLWQGFYSGGKRPAPVIEQPQPSPIDTSEADCLKAIFDAQERYGIPENLLLALGVQEAGRNSDHGLTVWPWSVNANGVGKYFATKQDALDWINLKQADGVTNIDVGCMQINQKWHGQAFSSIEEALDPVANVEYAARFLSDLHKSEKDWVRAAGRYHSSTPKYQTAYLEKLERNLNVANANVSALAQLALKAVDRSVIASAEVAPQSTDRPLWASASKVGEQRYSLYSSNPILPILPDLQEAF